MFSLKVVFLLSCTVAVFADYIYHDPLIQYGRSTIVHLFEWKFNDIANECENYLAPKGFGGVLISPITEHVILPGRPWHERYQPVSYKIASRSGTEDEFISMTKKCNAVGVRVYVDVVLNNMASPQSSLKTTANSTADFDKFSYPGVPYNESNFNTPCSMDFTDVYTERNCQFKGRQDLNQKNLVVRQKIVEHLNFLLKFGVAGFRLSNAENMWPNDLAVLISTITSVNFMYGLPLLARPLVVHEVTGNTKTDYQLYGRVTEFSAAFHLSKAVRNTNNKMANLATWGPSWGFLDSVNALVFVDTPATQRSQADIVTYKEPKLYEIANAFMLAHPYGLPRVMSSYEFTTSDDGPPQDANENIVSPNITSDGKCGNNWVCEHRWPAIANMVEFRNVVGWSFLQNWWDNKAGQIAFCRGLYGFIAINAEEDNDFDRKLVVCLPMGTYCDVISGSLKNGKCTGKTVTVDFWRTAQIKIGAKDDHKVIAIHWNSRVGN